MEFEDILLQVGHFGRYQRNLLILFLFPSAAFLPWFAMNNLFLISVPDHWCDVPELESWNLTLDQRRLLIPKNNSHCSMFELNYTDLMLHNHEEIITLGNWTAPPNIATKPCSHGWQYDKTYHEDTAATEWNMVCKNAHHVSLVLTLANVGSVIGAPLYGALSDKYGRKPTFFLVVLVTSVTAIASFLVSNLTAFLVLRAINGSLMPSIFQLPYIILLEIVGPEMRTRMNGIGNSSWAFGLCFLPLVAWLCRRWVTFGLVTSSVSVLYFLYWLILPESPRWLLSKERYLEAANILAKIGESNGKPQEPAELLLQLQALGDKIKKEKKLEDEDGDTSSLLKYPRLRMRFFIITLCWMANILSYYGLQINVPNLGGNEFLNFFLLAMVEIPGIFCSWFIMQRLGRRWCAVGALTLTGISCMVPVFVPQASVVSSLIGKFACTASFMAVYQQSSEIYPTNFRALGMGLNGTMAGLANIAVPYLVFLAVYGKFIPFVIISGVCLFAGFFASFLPETLHEYLPQSLTDAEKFGCDQRYFTLRNRKRQPASHRDCIPRRLTGENAHVELVRS